MANLYDIESKNTLVDLGRLHQREGCDINSATIYGKKNFTGENFWARGYFVSTVGLDEGMVREYIHTFVNKRRKTNIYYSLNSVLPAHGPLEG